MINYHHLQQNLIVFQIPLALNLYTLGYDNNKNLTNLNTATKTNLSTYLEQFRMLTDAINIKNAFIINFSLDFEITSFKNYNNNEVILNCITELKKIILILIIGK